RDSGVRRFSRFSALRIPPVRALSPIVSRACAGITGLKSVSWEEVAIELATRALLADSDDSTSPRVTDTAVRSVAAVVRAMCRNPAAPTNLGQMARAANLSPFHFLRTFERVTGVTPHQYARRLRLREAARRLATTNGRIIDAAFECGFGDVSNFNHAF